jgi:hypothetical protein
MSSPIYQPAAVVPHAVLDEEKEIIRTEGFFHVRQVYYANAFDADRARRWEAERRVAEKARSCTWCSKPIAGAPVVEAAAETIHADPCGKEFSSFTEAAPLIPLEQQLRKSIELGRIRDDELVQWGEWVDEDTPNERYGYQPVRWAELSVYERHTVERQANGKLVGGYPL